MFDAPICTNVEPKVKPWHNYYGIRVAILPIRCTLEFGTGVPTELYILSVGRLYETRTRSEDATIGGGGARTI